MATWQQYKIAAGYGVAANSLVNIESLSVSGVYFVSPKARGLYSPGEYKIRGNGAVYEAGYKNTTWLFDVMTYAQLSYLRTTYCNGGWSGQVTINTTLGDDTYYRCDAVMILPQPKDSDGEFYAIRRYPVAMTRIVPL